MAVQTRVFVLIATWILFAIVAERLLVPRQFVLLPADLFLPIVRPMAPLGAAAGWIIYIVHASVTLTRTQRRSFWLYWAALPVLLTYNGAMFTLTALQGLR